MKIKPSIAALNAVKSDPDRQLEISFDGNPHLKAIIQPTGHRAFHASFIVHGQRVRRKLGNCSSMTLKQASQEATKLYVSALAAAGQGIGKLSFRQFVNDHYLPAKQGIKKTLAEDISKLNRVILPRIGDRAIDRITTRHVAEIIDYLTRDNRSHSTRNSYLAVIKGVFSLAKQMQAIEHNPTDPLKIRPPDNTRDRVLSREECARLIQTINKNPDEAAGQLLICLLLTGLRISEALNLKYDDIDVQSKVIRLRSSKNRQRKVHLHSRACDWLGARYARYGAIHDYVFQSQFKKGPISRPQRAIERIFREADIADAWVHDLRRTWATNLVNAGVPVDTISKLMDHCNSNVTQRYLCISDRILSEAANQSTFDIEGLNHG